MGEYKFQSQERAKKQKEDGNTGDGRARAGFSFDLVIGVLRNGAQAKRKGDFFFFGWMDGWDAMYVWSREGGRER